VRSPVQNKERRYIAGLDSLEEWDHRMMDELQIPMQYLS